jgi:hypothetical protein
MFPAEHVAGVDAVVSPVANPIDRNALESVADGVKLGKRGIER